MGDAGEGGREVEQEERAKGVVARSLVDRRIHFDDVGGYVAALEETALLGKAESGSEEGKDHIENRGDDTVVAIYHRNGASISGCESGAKGGRGAGRLLRKQEEKGLVEVVWHGVATGG